MDELTCSWSEGHRIEVPPLVRTISAFHLVKLSVLVHACLLCRERIAPSTTHVDTWRSSHHVLEFRKAFRAADGLKLSV